jgi:ABC-type multidrug transport system ATPase subunit
VQLEISGVSKAYRGGKQAVAGVSMRIGPGVLVLHGT